MKKHKHEKPGATQPKGHMETKQTSIYFNLNNLSQMKYTSELEMGELIQKKINGIFELKKTRTYYLPMEEMNIDKIEDFNQDAFEFVKYNRKTKEIYFKTKKHFNLRNKEFLCIIKENIFVKELPVESPTGHTEEIERKTQECDDKGTEGDSLGSIRSDIGESD